MIVPRTRLLIVVAAFGLPLAALAGTMPAAASLAGLAMVILAAVVVSDAAEARRQLDGVSVALPELVRLQKDRPGSVEISLHNRSQKKRPLRLGFAFPRELQAEADEREILLPAGAELSRLEWSCTPTRRGQYLLSRAYLEARSNLGLWAARASQPVKSELRVYPDLLADRKQVAALFLRRNNVGTRAQRQAGQGRDFEKLRNYLPGDSVSEIHWKASAKRGHPVTKVFQVERTQEVYVVIDASRLSGRTVATSGNAVVAPSALERYVSAALLLGLAAEQQGDQFGLITFSDRVLSFVRAKSGQAHYDACRDQLFALQPQIVAPDFDELAAFIRLRLRKRALLILLTALDDPMLAESFTKNVELICRQHLVIANMLQPPGAQPMFASEAVGEVDDLYGQLGGHLQWHQLRELRTVLQRLGVRFHLLDPEKLPSQLIGQHAEVKARQLL